MKNWIYKHRFLVAGCIATILFVALLASCQGLINVNGSSDSPVVIQESFNHEKK